jgi:hypothetical protein
MPIPDPGPNEDQSEYVSRCIAAQSGEDRPDDQKSAICYSKFQEGLVARREAVAKTFEERLPGE